MRCGALLLVCALLASTQALVLAQEDFAAAPVEEANVAASTEVAPDAGAASFDYAAHAAALGQENQQLQLKVTELQNTITELQSQMDVVKSERFDWFTANQASEAAFKEAKSKLTAVEEELNTCHSNFITKEHEAAQTLRATQAELRAAQQELVALKISAQTGFGTKVTFIASNLVNSTSTLVTELSRGNTTGLTTAAVETLNTFYTAADSARTVLNQKVEEHLPWLQEHVNQLKGLWRKHVSESTWAAGLRDQFVLVEAELHAVIVNTGSKVPGLAPIVADPVAAQLIVYLVMVLPLALLALPMLILCCRAPASSTESGAAAKRKRRTKQSFSKGGVTRLTSFERNVKDMRD